MPNKSTVSAVTIAPRDTDIPAEERKQIALKATEGIYDLELVQETIANNQQQLAEMAQMCDEVRAALQHSQSSGSPMDPAMGLKIKTFHAMAGWMRTSNEALEGEIATLLRRIPQLRREVKKEAWANLWRAIKLSFGA